VTGVALVAVGALLAIGASDRGWRRFTPYRALYEWVPGWRSLRATDRAWFIGMLGMALLAGLGAVAIGRWVTARGLRVGTMLVVALAGVGIVVEGYAPWTGLPTARVAPVDAYLERRSDSGGVVYLPANATGSRALDLSIWEQPKNMYSATAHHHRTPNGFASYVPASYAKTFSRLRTLPGPRALAMLRALHVRYVVVHEITGGPWQGLRDPDRARPLALVGRFGSDLLYEVPNASPATR
jgi:hypothetical protein